MGLTLTLRKRHVGIFFVVLALIVGGGLVWAQQTWPAVGHSRNQIEPCANGEILQMTGTTWGCGTVPLGFWSLVGGTGPDIYRGSGNVGIGTANPGSKLQVIGDIRSSEGDVATDIFSSVGVGSGYIGTRTNHPLRIRTNDQDKVTIDTNGNVGIGTLTPSAKLEVIGEVKAGRYWDENSNYFVDSNIESSMWGIILGEAVQGGAQDKGYIRFRETGDDTGIWHYADGKMTLRADGTDRVFIDNDGDVAIGDNKYNPRYKLDVYGDIIANRFRGPADSADVATLANDLACTNCVSSGDLANDITVDSVIANNVFTLAPTGLRKLHNGQFTIAIQVSPSSTVSHTFIGNIWANNPTDVNEPAWAWGIDATDGHFVILNRVPGENYKLKMRCLPGGSCSI